MRILVVEDIPDVAATFAGLIRAYGHRTQVAGDGPSALRIAKEFKPDMVFLDIGLPGMDGYELAARLRQLEDLRSPILVSVSGREPDPERSKEVGLDHQLSKPVQINTLLQLLAG